MPAETPAAPSPDIAASLDSFLGTPAPAAPVSATPAPEVTPTPASTPEAKATPTPTPEPNAGDLDLSGAIETESAAKLEKAHGKPSDKPAEPEAKTETESVGIKQLRDQYSKTKKELDELRAKAKAEIDPAEIATIKQEREALQTKLKQIETERDEYAKNLAKADFSKSPEFKEKYLKPWQDAQQEALDELSQFQKTGSDGKAANVTWEDIKPLLTLPAPEAAAKAREIFGDDATLAMDHRRRILEKGKQWKTALDQHEAESQNLAVERTKMETQLRQTFDSEQNRLATDIPELYLADEKNPREVEQYKKSADISHAALFGLPGMNPETRFKAAAIVHKRAAMFPVIAIRLKGAESRIAQLEGELLKARGGGPGGGVTEGAPKVSGELNIGDDMDRWVAAQPKR